MYKEKILLLLTNTGHDWSSPMVAVKYYNNYLCLTPIKMFKKNWKIKTKIIPKAI